MKEIKIGGNEAGQRLDKFLSKYMDQAPKSFFYKMLRKKNIVLNGKKAAGNEILSQGDSVKLFLSDETIEKFTGKKTESPVKLSGEKPAILYEDEHTVFFCKPAGMLSQKAEAADVSLVEYLISYLMESGQLRESDLQTFRPSVCNRLDRNTSGIVAAGKTLPALQQLSQVFRERTIGKYYLCLVKGNVAEGKKISGYLSKDEKTNKVSVQKEKRGDAARIETEYRPLKQSGDVTLLEIHLITGKTHQIRAHLASEGHPIIGDYKYGNRSANDRYKKQYGLESQLLHSYRLCFPKMDGALEQLSGKEILAPVPDLFLKICRDRGVM